MSAHIGARYMCGSLSADVEERSTRSRVDFGCLFVAVMNGCYVDA